MKHKTIILPDIDLSHDDGDQSWHAAGGQDMTPDYNDDGSIRHYRWNGLSPGHYAEYYRLCVAGSWKQVARAYEANPDDVFRAWCYVDGHPVFWSFTRALHEGYPVNHVSNLVHDGAFSRGWPEITPHKVNPGTRRVERKKKKNTLLEWWYEFGPSDLNGGCSTHDWELDGGASSYEGCVLAVARKIHRFYGNDRRLVDAGDSYWKNRVVKKEKNRISNASLAQLVEQRILTPRGFGSNPRRGTGQGFPGFSCTESSPVKFC